MCVMSMVMDHYRDKWQPLILPPITFPAPLPPSPAEIEEFQKLMDRAREYDKKHNQPDCELDEKRKALKKIAEDLGIKIDFL